MKLSTITASAVSLVALAYVSAAAAAGSTPAAPAKPVFMSGPWASAACKAWNENPTLTEKLKKSGWVDNNNKRGFKIMQIYRNDCPNSPRVEMRIMDKDGKATCTYGGLAQAVQPNSNYDYVMHASTKNWKKMGSGDLGPMWAMTTFRLKFSGPMGEAMSNMGPFKQFLLLTGKVPSNYDSCPAAVASNMPAKAGAKK
jgi:putative sterol carrier protein